jgi:hypothetical protein
VALREFSLTIEALRRKLRQHASSAVMISVMRSARGKIHGIARAVHNSEKRARYNQPIAPSVDLVRFPSWRIARIKRNMACSAYHQKRRSATRNFCEAPHLREIGQEG